MADERNTHLEKAAADDGRSFADDAVSNRSDDTALDEADVAVSRDRNWSPAEPADDEDAQSERGDERGEHADEPPVEDEAGAEASESEEAVEAEATDSLPTAGVPTSPKVEMMEPEPEEEIRMDWYILKVQSNRERSISEALERKMKIEGLDRYFDQAIVPTEKVTEFKAGKKKVVERKLYPGYIVVHMHINDDTWFAVRETSGVGDFTGAGGKPTAMLPHEVARIIQTEEEEATEAPKLDIRFAAGDKVKVKEGNFESFEGEVGSIDEASGRVTVMINIFGRSTPVELEYWQIEAV
ncbi:MAG: transcription termination/antitermination protein NusG [Pirellulales bacterium]